MQQKVTPARGRQTRIRNQIFFFTLVPMLIGVVLLSLTSIRGVTRYGETQITNLRTQLMSQKKEELRHYVEMAIAAIDGLPRDQARRILKQMRFDDASYFWIQDTTKPYPRMIMHSTVPAWDGRIMDDPSFNVVGGRQPHLFLALSELVAEKGEGFVEYRWKKFSKQGSGEPQPKISFVKLYKPFNWVIGNGIYLDDIDATIARERATMQSGITTVVTSIVLGAGLVLVLVFLSVSYCVNRFVARPIEEMTAAVKECQNDLTLHIPVTSNNEVGELAVWFNSYVQTLHDIISRLALTATELNRHASEISGSVDEQAANTSGLSAATAEITSTMEELSASSTQIAEHSKTVVEIANRTWIETKKGSESIETVIRTMGEINEENQQSIQAIVELGRKSKEISKIMEIINNIADQTKLIAFNAALEASSAGEAGRRFGVVAAEIRRLADSVMESTGGIEAKTTEIQDYINRLIITSERGSVRVRKGIDDTMETAEVLNAIVDAAQETTGAAQQISLSTQQQKTASGQVVVALREIVGVTGQTTDSFNRIQLTSRDIAGMSEELQALIRTFNLKSS